LIAAAIAGRHVAVRLSAIVEYPQGGQRHLHLLDKGQQNLELFLRRC
jgi:hypothetical protein